MAGDVACALEDEEDPVKGAPEDEVECGAVPESAEEHGDHEVAIEGTWFFCAATGVEELRACDVGGGELALGKGCEHGFHGKFLGCTLGRAGRRRGTWLNGGFVRW